jgi:hypothetical protein
MRSPLRLGVPNAGPWWHLGLLGGRVDGASGIRGVDNWLTLSSLSQRQDMFRLFLINLINHIAENITLREIGALHRWRTSSNAALA